MYYERHHSDKKNKKNYTCHINNTKYLAVQRYSYGMWLWFSLCWRDIFRLLILIVIVDKMLRNNLFRGFGFCLLIPHLLFSSLFVFLKIYAEINNSTYKYKLYEWCIFIIGYILASILALLILPSSTFYSLHWGQEYGDISRLFTDCEDIQPLTMYLLRYILNCNTTQEIKRRIVVVNYYTTLLFTDKINVNCLQKIDYFANMHNSNRDGLCNIKWSDVQNAGAYSIHSTHSRWFKSILALLMVIYDITLITFLQQKLVLSWSVLCWVYIAMDILLVLFDIKYFQIYWYCYHILPFVNEVHSMDGFSWDKKCGNVDEIKENFNILYGIMFDSMEKTALLQHAWPNVHPDIANIIGQYLWSPLPIYANYDEKEFTLKFDKMMKSFKDCNNCTNESAVCINTCVC